MKRHWRAVLIVIAVLSFGIALSYPVLYHRAEESNNSALGGLSDLRQAVISKDQLPTTQSSGTAEVDEVSLDALPEEEPRELTIDDFLLDYVPGMTWRQVTIPEYEENGDAPVMLSNSVTLENREERTGALPYPMKEKVELDEEKILPELKEIYALNKDLVGWLTIPGTVVDYPVVQTKDSDFYLHHDFYGEENQNGQIILDTRCDPYTPSYNLVISGHHMRNGSMFGAIPQYKDKGFWQEHRFVEFDSLMERKTYVIFAAFYSADYDEFEDGFRYNADIQYVTDAKQWISEIRASQVYDTGIDVAFGDEFITLTTCDRSRRQDGRFVLVCRRIREGETF